VKVSLTKFNQFHRKRSRTNLQSHADVNASATRPTNAVNPDIFLKTVSANALIEIYSPIGHYGDQFIKNYYSGVFLYSEFKHGYNLDIRLIVNDQYRFDASDIPNDDKLLREWLTKFRNDFDNWIGSAVTGDWREFEKINNSFKLKVFIHDLYDDPQMREIQFPQIQPSNDVQLFFKNSPECNAQNQMGRKIRTKLKKRQCGTSKPNLIRMLILNFNLTYCRNSQWLNCPMMIGKIDETIRLIVDQIEGPLPYDVVIPAMINNDCCYGDAVILDGGRADQIHKLISDAHLDKKCIM
ncbi:MAG: hypothetical protein OXE59_10815, partial [Bacteroidetes bacterium]|nr:hypothetical protein [Bacteroidota bacterium]